VSLVFGACCAVQQLARRQVRLPVEAALRDAQLDAAQVDEVVLVGGSTRMPAVRRAVASVFGGRAPRGGVDPELAVVTGVAVQAGVLGGGWPLQVGAIELPARLRKVHVYRQDAR